VSCSDAQSTPRPSIGIESRHRTTSIGYERGCGLRPPDPGGVLKNHELRIAAANKIIDEHNARIDKAEQDAADRAAKNRPAL
jgi:hypothetical protein